MSVASITSDGVSPVCVIAPYNGGDAQVFPIEKCFNYVCHSPGDYQKIIEWGRRRANANE